MLRIFSLTVLLALMIGAAHADDIQHSSPQLNADEQITLDLAQLDIEYLVTPSAKTLTEIQVSPSSAAGSAVNEYNPVPGAKAGVPFEILGASRFLGWNVSGHYKPLATFGATKASISGNYQWTAKSISILGAYLLRIDRPLLWTDHDNRFLLGGTVVCRFDSAAIGSSQFTDDALIPTAWQHSLAGAVTYHKEHPELFVESNVIKNINALTALQDDPNPFLSLDASRCLLKDRPVDPTFVQSHLANADLYKQAALTLIALSDASPGASALMTKEIGDLISSSVSSESIRGIALAAFVTDDAVLLSRLDQKMAQLKTHAATDDYIINIIRLAKINRTMKAIPNVIPTALRSAAPATGRL